MYYITRYVISKIKSQCSKYKIKSLLMVFQFITPFYMTLHNGITVVKASQYVMYDSLRGGTETEFLTRTSYINKIEFNSIITKTGTFMIHPHPQTVQESTGVYESESTDTLITRQYGNKYLSGSIQQKLANVTDILATRQYGKAWVRVSGTSLSMLHMVASCATRSGVSMCEVLPQTDLFHNIP